MLDIPHQYSQYAKHSIASHKRDENTNWTERLGTNSLPASRERKHSGPLKPAGTYKSLYTAK